MNANTQTMATAKMASAGRMIFIGGAPVMDDAGCYGFNKPCRGLRVTGP